jgi:hypothetical protein
MRAAAPRLGAEALESRAMMAALVRTLAASQPDLAPASDSGWSLADNRTSVSTPTFSGTTRGGAASVNLFDGQTRIGTAPVVNGTWTFTVDPAGALPSGRHSISAQALDAGGNFGLRSRALAVELITSAPLAPTVGLNPQSDSGTLGDNRTNIVRPRIGGVAPAGSKVFVSVNGASHTPVTPVRGGWGTWPSPFANGTQTITVYSENVAGLRSSLTTYSFTVDTVKPTAMLAFVEADNEVEVRFSRPVSGVDTADFRVAGMFSGRPFDLPLNSRQVVQTTGGFSVTQKDADGMVYRIRMNQPEIYGGTYTIRLVAAKSVIFDKVVRNPLQETSQQLVATFQGDHGSGGGGMGH